MYNPYIQGWINYYGNFYRTQLRPTLKRIDLYVIRWARRKFKRLRRKTKGAPNGRRHGHRLLLERLTPPAFLRCGTPQREQRRRLRVAKAGAGHP